MTLICFLGYGHRKETNTHTQTHVHIYAVPGALNAALFRELKAGGDDATYRQHIST